MMGYGGYEGFGWMLGGGLMMLPMMLLFWIGPIALAVWGVGRLRESQRPSAHDETPLEALRRRYAAGELAREQYEEMRRVLEG